MSRITGNQVASLMEAYQAVYAPQQLTEEQVWEEVENWVNNLLEEGYNLSDYTWEEMYESYLSEGGPGAGAAASYAAQQKKAQGTVNTALQRGGNVAVSNNGGFLSGPMRSGSARLNSAQTKAGGRTVLDYKPDTVTTRSGAKVAPVQSSASIRLGGRAFDRLTTKKGVQYLERKPGVTPTPASAKPSGTPPLSGGFKDGKIVMDNRRPAPAAATPTARPAAPAPTARPAAAPAPTARPAAKLPAGPAGPAPAARGAAAPGAPLRDEPLWAMKGDKPQPPAGPLAATVAAASKPPAFSPSSAAPTMQRSIPSGTSVPVKPATPAATGNTMGNPPLAPRPLPPIGGKPSLASDIEDIKRMQTDSRKRQGLTQSFDLFDVVLGHLLDEGYADTEEAALVIMSNMSEEWRDEILDEAGRMHSSSDQQAGFARIKSGEVGFRGPEPMNDDEIKSQKGGPEFLERIKKTKKNPKYKK